MCVKLHLTHLLCLLNHTLLSTIPLVMADPEKSLLDADLEKDELLGYKKDFAAYLRDIDLEDQDKWDQEGIYSRGEDIGLSKGQINRFLNNRDKDPDAPTGSIYEQRDAAARERNDEQAGNRGATNTKGLDRQRDMQGTATGATRNQGKRSLEGEQGRAERYARRAQRKGHFNVASQILAGAYGKALKNPVPNIKSEDYREEEEANRQKLLADEARRREIEAKSMNTYEEMLDKIKRRRDEETDETE